MSQTQQLELFQGENRTFSLAARDNSNNPTDLTGKSVTWNVAYPPYDPSLSQALITKTGTVTSASGGIYTVAITPQDTQCLAEGNYIHQAYTTDSGGSVSVVTAGVFTLLPIVMPIQ